MSIHFHSFPFISINFQSFPFIFIHFHSFPFISSHFQSFPFISNIEKSPDLRGQSADWRPVAAWGLWARLDPLRWCTSGNDDGWFDPRGKD
jgi:hypothetical protein